MLGPPVLPEVIHIKAHRAFFTFSQCEVAMKGLIAANVLPKVSQ
jgi:hypothetical protein